MAKDIHVKMEIEVPSVPNFLRIGKPTPRLRQEGFVERPTIDVADVDDDSLRALGAEWTNALLANAAKRRVNRDTTESVR